MVHFTSKSYLLTSTNFDHYGIIVPRAILGSFNTRDRAEEFAENYKKVRPYVEFDILEVPTNPEVTNPINAFKEVA